MTEACSIHWWN